VPESTKGSKTGIREGGTIKGDHAAARGKGETDQLVAGKRYQMSLLIEVQIH